MGFNHAVVEGLACVVHRVALHGGHAEHCGCDDSDHISKPLMFMRGRFSAADNTVYTSIMAQSMRYDRLPTRL
jgi:hypothetical protein